MKINNLSPQNSQSKKLSPEQVREKLQEKFGNKVKAKPEKKPVEDKVELREQSFDVHQTATVGKNDPNSDITQDKLRDILKTGAFDFNPSERKALAQILK
ncbi:MAG: hypothetical protein CME65_00305 [Halobacteriovoraceae bacterium]|nr:hypothetical protein [Halobacteriovoraceae bacterium]|tara:strand:- start:236 stop:535 length:300 start_codon:yes stop_codon:yes gene_type:complete